eukprot:TRINITY_DN12952_c0_g1_i3.p1 TRINITY_DN12952_c0_g1~~TRINITY_DN12952_c0_g1_i3.p1  ORF type:complete len:374 (+),score=25.65 TRINITY_DN12952_c0_g1_i3:59-1180(+)
MEMEDSVNQQALASHGARKVPLIDEAQSDSSGSVISTAEAIPCSSRDTSALQSGIQQSPGTQRGVITQPMTSRPPRVFEVWHQHGLGGRNKFHCCGHCVTGPQIDFWYNVCAWSFIVIPTGFYFIVCSKYLWQRVSIWLPILTALVLFSTVFFLLLTSCTDPGILPRQQLRQAIPGLEEEVIARLGAISSTVQFDPETAEPFCLLTESDAQLGYRWCHTCKVVRPPRCSHCNDCDNCVLMFDHHCPFVHNCVGQRNYAFFSAFLASTACLGFSVAVGFWIYFSDYAHGRDGPVSFEHNPLVFLALLLIGLPTGILLLGVLGLSVFHVCLACWGRTTKEVFTGKFTVAGRTLFHVRGPSLIHSRAQPTLPLTAV